MTLPYNGLHDKLQFVSLTEKARRLRRAFQTVEKPLFCVKQDRGSLHIEG